MEEFLLDDSLLVETELVTLTSKNVPTRSSQSGYIGFEACNKWLVDMGLDMPRVASNTTNGSTRFGKLSTEKMHQILAQTNSTGYRSGVLAKLHTR